MDDQFYMRKALELAAKGDGWTSPNPSVGAVVVGDGQIVGEGWHRAAGLPHAEVVALDDAGEATSGATLYVTLEPCHHTGRTPPCTSRIIESGISRVVMAMRDPNPGVRGGGGDFLESKGITVTEGICEQEARRLNECFIKHVTTGLPFGVVKCAATLDGQIAAGSGDSKWISGPDSREYVHRLRHRLDAILVGVNTVKIDNPALTTRLKDGEGKNPLRIILDTGLSIPEASQVLEQKAKHGTLIATGPHTSRDKTRRLEERGIEVIICPLKEGRVDLGWLMRHVGARGVTGVLIEGGSRVIGSAFAEKIVDKVCFYYAPRIMGGASGYPMIGGKGVDRISDCLKICHLEVHRFNEDVLIEGYPDYELSETP